MYGFAICLGLGLLFGFLVRFERKREQLCRIGSRILIVCQDSQPVAAMQSSVFFLMPVKFAILYTLANLLFIARWASSSNIVYFICTVSFSTQLTSQVLCSTMFLMGPLAQAKKMFEKGRIIATCLYFGAMFLTLWMAIKVFTTSTYMDHSHAAPTRSIKCIVYHVHAVCTGMPRDDM